VRPLDHGRVGIAETDGAGGEDLWDEEEQNCRDEHGAAPGRRRSGRRGRRHYSSSLSLRNACTPYTTSASANTAKTIASVAAPFRQPHAATKIDNATQTMTKTMWKMRSDIHHFPILSAMSCSGSQI